MTTELAAGAVVAGFRVESLVGHGAMARVYRARDEANDRVVALKILDDALARDERFRQRFLRESQLAASLTDPHIVRTLGSGEEDGQLYLAMEYVDGSDLRQLLRQDGRLEPERAIDLVEQVASALDTAHAAGLIHRDVKPGNILVGSDADGEHAYVCDFGLARHVSSVSSLTGDRGFVGTIDYVPPEQIEGGQVDARADVYSLGCVLYECLAGVRPFDRDSELSVVFAHLNEPPPRLTDVRPELPAAFDEVFATALAKAPDDRYSSCGELAAAARAALRGEVLARRRPRRRLLAVAVIAILVVAAAAGAFLLTRKGHTPAPVTITQTSIAEAKLGDSSSVLDATWGGGVTLGMQFPPDYSVLTTKSRNVSAYFVGTTDKTVEITTWNAADRTAEGIGPCSTVAQLKRTYGTQLKASPSNIHNGVVVGYTLGKHLFFALGPGTTPKVVEAIALYSNPLRSAAYNGLNEGPCGRAANTTPVVRHAAAPATAPPALPKTLTSRLFRPRLTLGSPTAWSIQSDTRHGFTIASPAGTSIHFWLDPFASRPSTSRRPNGVALPNISRTPPGLVAWLQRNKALAASAPQTTLLGHPTLTTSSIDVALSPTSSRGRITYLTFSGHGYTFSFGARRGEHARVYLASIRIDTVVHTLAMVVDSPSVKAFNAALPVAAAIVKSLKLTAVPVLPISALSTQCHKPFGGTCLGELTAGTHTTTTFRPALTYTVPVGWTNFSDQDGGVGFVPPGGDWGAVDAGKSDYLGVFTSIATARAGCAAGASSIHTPTAFVQWLHEHEPGLAPFHPTRVAIGGLSGYVVDLRIRADWTKACTWSQGTPTVQVLTGLDPTPGGLAHGLIPQPMSMRLYLLAYHHGTLGIEIDEVRGSSKLDAYSAVVKTFRFGKP
jgi:tRNA A-37 threonylcarbamoyl transferase component Bud32